MIVQYCSDLHLEFKENEEYLKANPLQPMGDVLLLAGDVVPFARLRKYNDFFNRISDQFEHTYWVPGNHEYYHADITERSGTVHEKIRDNIVLINNQTVDHGEVRFIFSTLWSHISPVNQNSIQQFMTDFHVIKSNGRQFTPQHFNDLHDACKKFITAELQGNSAGKSIVVSHHVPTFLNYPEKYKDDALNEAFAVELYDLIEPSGVQYWLFGHHHQAVPTFQIGTTRLISNQLGYVRYREHLGFIQGKSIDTND